MLENIHRTLQITLLMTFTVIILGAYTRLKDAGLGCPDWPGCYGQLFAPAVSDTFNQSAVIKAWIEMIHRYVAGSLGILILILSVQTIRARKHKPNLWLFALSVLALVIFQALLGMWTVTMRLNPLVVMGHLLGGICILALLWWLYLHMAYPQPDHSRASFNKSLSIIAIAVLACQIALGGWTSANYAAVVCADFPTCQGHLWPNMDWANAFALPGAPLENAARVTIQMAHRIGALITTLLVTFLAFKVISSGIKVLKLLGLALLSLLGIQIILGIANVLAGLPLAVSLAHNAVAVLLLLCSISILHFINGKDKRPT